MPTTTGNENLSFQELIQREKKSLADVLMNTTKCAKQEADYGEQNLLKNPDSAFKLALKLGFSIAAVGIGGAITVETAGIGAVVGVGLMAKGVSDAKKYSKALIGRIPFDDLESDIKSYFNN